MRVAELIEKLKELDESTIVFIDADDFIYPVENIFFEKAEHGVFYMTETGKYEDKIGAVYLG